MPPRRSRLPVVLLLAATVGCTPPLSRPLWLAPDLYDATTGTNGPRVAPLWSGDGAVLEAYRATYRPPFGKPIAVWIERRTSGILVRANVPDPTYSRLPHIRSGSRVVSVEDWARLQFYLEGADFWHQTLAGVEPGCNWGIDSDSWQFEGFRARHEYVAFTRFCPDAYLSGMASFLDLIGPPGQ